MPVITRLVAGKRNPNRVNVYLDGIFSFALSIDEVVKNSLKKGLTLSDEAIAVLKERDETDYLYLKILNFISYRPRTVKEVQTRLYQYKVTDPLKQKSLIKRLIDEGHLDDFAFARWFIASRNKNRVRSLRHIQQELMSKGVSREIIQALSSEVINAETSIASLLAKKLGQPRPLSSPERQKISRYLARLGYPWEKIQAVVKNWESE